MPKLLEHTFDSLNWIEEVLSWSCSCKRNPNQTIDFWLIFFFSSFLSAVAVNWNKIMALGNVSMSPAWPTKVVLVFLFAVAARECPLSSVYSWHFDEVHWAYNAIAHSEVIVIKCMRYFYEKMSACIVSFSVGSSMGFCVRVHAYYFICIVANDYTQRMHPDNGIAFDFAVLFGSLISYCCNLLSANSKWM